MLSINSFDKIYLYRPFADFRKGIYGLCGVIQEQMQLNPFERYLFLFCNRHRNKLKAIYWDETGFVMWVKALEVEKFHWPGHLEGDCLEVDLKALDQFLTGLNPWQRGHKKLNYSST
jgi:transposase